MASAGGHGRRCHERAGFPGPHRARHVSPLVAGCGGDVHRAQGRVCHTHSNGRQVSTSGRQVSTSGGRSALGSVAARRRGSRKLPGSGQGRFQKGGDWPPQWQHTSARLAGQHPRGLGHRHQPGLQWQPRDELSTEPLPRFFRFLMYVPMPIPFLPWITVLFGSQGCATEVGSCCKKSGDTLLLHWQDIKDSGHRKGFPFKLRREARAPPYRPLAG